MKIYSVLQIGTFHTNHCEDFFVNAQFGAEQQLVAVLDGCSTGTESAFASMLFGKILRQIAKKQYYLEFTTGQTLDLKQGLALVMRQLFEQAAQAKNNLGLDTKELLSTIVLSLVDMKAHTAEVIVVGDGLVYWDGEAIEYDQDNRPDYLGYHLAEDFDLWYQQQRQKLSIDEFNNLAFSTDGIFTFKPVTRRIAQRPEADMVSFLLADHEYMEHPNFLERKVRFIQDEWKHQNSDDLAIVRLMT